MFLFKNRYMVHHLNMLYVIFATVPTYKGLRGHYKVSALISTTVSFTENRFSIFLKLKCFQKTQLYKSLNLPCYEMRRLATVVDSP